MKALVCESPRTLKLIERPKPVFGKREALVRIHKVGVCGTDLHAYEGVQPYFSYPRILGHELAAEFIDGDESGFASGDRVTIIPYLNCNSCVACRMGKPNCCVKMSVCGVHQDGGMAEYFVIPSGSIVRGDGLSYDELALVEPLAIGTHALDRAMLRQDEYVLIVGAGPIGLGIMEVAAIRGARVIAMDVNQHRLDFCQNRFGITYSINPSTADAYHELMTVTGGDMPTLVIDATGSQRAINEGYKWMAHGGRYILVGLQKNDISFPHPEFHKREGTLMSSRNATRENFEYVVENIRTKRIDVNKFITHRVPFDQVTDEFDSLLDPGNGVVKAVIDLV